MYLVSNCHLFILTSFVQSINNSLYMMSSTVLQVKQQSVEQLGRLEWREGGGGGEGRESINTNSTVLQMKQQSVEQLGRLEWGRGGRALILVAWSWK